MRSLGLMALLGLPCVLGVLLGVTMEVGLLPAPIFLFSIQASTSVVAGLLGSGLSVLSILTWWLLRRWNAALGRARVDGRRIQDEAHRRFVHRLNHELKNPLTAIQAGLTNLQETGSQTAQTQASLSNVRRQVERLGNLANDLRKLADLEAGQVEQEHVDLPAIVQEAIETVRSTPRRGDREITMSIQKLPWPLTPAQGDPDLLLLAIYNLLDNALKFSDPDSFIELRVGEDGMWATVEVTDTGRGIAAHELAHVTEELYRGQDTQGVEGSGLGLALVDRIAMLHGGELIIRSRQGQGTVTMLRLPLSRK